MKKNKSITQPVTGMQRENFEHFLDEKTFTFQKNGNIETDEHSIGLTNEHSNLLCSKFINPITNNNFKVIGHKYDSIGKRVFFFLTDIENGISEIGQIKFTKDIDNIEDFTKECNCDFKSILSEPLEEVEQQEICNYETIISDKCQGEGGCLKFSIDNPIHDIVYKFEQTGGSLYWTDGVQPYRYIKLDALDHYTTKTVPCTDIEEQTCLDCEKLRVFNLFDRPHIEAEAIVNGGNLKRGRYFFKIAYCNVRGDELTSYFSNSGGVSIFDQNRNIMDQSGIFDETSMAIKLNVSDLDTRFNYYKVACIRTSSSGGYEVVTLPIQSTSNSSVVYSSHNSDIDTKHINSILQPKTIYETVDGIESANNYLLAYGLKEHRTWNLQPIVNILGSLVKWGSFMASEDLYKNGVDDAKFGSYMRDEVYPLGIRFGTNEGYLTNLMPFIGRPPSEFDLEEINSVSHKDEEYVNLESIVENSNSCLEYDRNKRWQLFNTSEVEDIEIPSECSSGFLKGDIKVINDIGTGFIENYINIQSPDYDNQFIPNEQKRKITWIIEPEGEFNDISDWILNNKEEIENSASESNNHQDIINFLNSGNLSTPESEPVLSFPKTDNGEPTNEAGFCYDVVYNEENSFLEFGGIEGVEIEKEDRIFPSEYEKTQEKECEVYMLDNRSRVNNPQAHVYENLTLKERVYFRNVPISGVSCSETRSINKLSDHPIVFNFKFQFANLYEENNILISNNDAEALPSDYPEYNIADYRFLDKIHVNAQWLQYDFEEIDGVLEDKVFIEFTKAKEGCFKDIATASIPIVRYHIFKDCDTIVDSGFYNIYDGKLFQFNREDFLTGKIIIALDTPIEFGRHDYDLLKDSGKIRERTKAVFKATSAPSSFKVKVRPKEYKRIELKFDKISFDKVESYTSKCNYFLPDIDNCDPQPFQRGKFGYVESTIEYPDNKELYDSSKLNISINDIPEKYREEFINYYVQGVEDGKIIWKKDLEGKPLSDFRCRNIRHFKFPDNSTSPFINKVPLTPFDNSVIYPLGVYIDKEVISSFLDIAVNNGLLSQEERDSITYYEVFRGDRKTQKSVLFKGLANDMIKDPTEKNTYFRNFPYNDLGKNKFLTGPGGGLIRHQFSGLKNNKFSVISPDIYLDKTQNPTEVYIEGYMFGKSIGGFKSVEEHSKWVILGDKSKRLASTLATLEVVFETTTKVTEMLVEAQKGNWYIGGVFGIGTGSVGMAISTGLAIAYAAIAVGNAVLFKHTKYKAQWLQTFKNMGNPHNFAEYYISPKGHYNYFKPNNDYREKLRGIKKNIYLGSGVPMFNEGGSTIRINNRGRESSLYVSFGDNFFLEPPRDYINFDNSSTNELNSSRFLSSEEWCNNITDIERNIASPYFSMKTYRPDQYGSIDSISWIQTPHKGKLDEDFCEHIFGGDIRISRVDLKNKFPLFYSNAIGAANRLPFKYSDPNYKNVANTRFYCDYDVNTGSGSLLSATPTQDSEYNFDCLKSKSDFYVKSPAKFYLYSYGIPYFMVESEINVNYRYAGVEPHEQFASNGIDVEKWTQEVNVAIGHDNIFRYNQTYSDTVAPSSYSTFPIDYSEEHAKKLEYNSNDVIYSNQDNNEQSLDNPWLVYKPYNRGHFRMDYGKLINMVNIESELVFCLFENQAAVFNAVDVLKERINSANEDLGLSGMFQQRPMEYHRTELGETGTQHKAFVSTEFGHFWTDAERGKVNYIGPNGKGYKPISDVKMQGGESGMRKWFKKNLPFRITNVEGIGLKDIDNAFKDVGIVMWWDSKFRRVFIAKKDYLPKNDNIKWSKENGFHIILNEGCKENCYDEVENQIFCRVGYTYDNDLELCKKTEFKELECPEGYKLNELTNKCEKIIYKQKECPEGYSYDTKSGNCKKINLSLVECHEGYELNLDTGMCERKVYSNVVCEDGFTFNPLYNLCERKDEITCPEGTELDYENNICIITDDSLKCNIDYTYDPTTEMCVANDPEEFPQTEEPLESLSPTISFTRIEPSCSDSLDDGQCVEIEQVEPLPCIGERDGNYCLNEEFRQIEDYNTPSNNSEYQYIDIVDPLCNGTIIDNKCKTELLEYPICNGDIIDGKCIERIKNEYNGEILKVSVFDEKYFDDVSWTVAYSPMFDSWISYYDFKPNYAIAYNSFFQTGVNFAKDNKELGLWSHLLTNKSFQVFYGKKYPWVIEYPEKNVYNNKVFDNISLWTRTYRYHNERDFAEWRKNSFNEVVIYNNTNNSGYLKLNYIDSLRRRGYPKKIDNLSQGIPATHYDSKITFNYFFNRVSKEDYHVPIWNRDLVDIDKVINRQAVKMSGKRVLERMRGEWFLIRLSQYESSQFKQVFKWSENNTNLY